MKAMNVCLFIICFNFAFLIIAPMGLFGGHVGPAGTPLNFIQDERSLVVDLVITGLVLGGVVIAGWSFKSSAVVGAFGLIYAFSVGIFITIFDQMMAGMGVDIIGATVIKGVILALYAFVGVEGALQISGTPFGIME